MRFENASEFSESRKMSAVCEASVLVREIAEPRPVGDSVKAASLLAASLLFAWVTISVASLPKPQTRTADPPSLNMFADFPSGKTHRENRPWPVAGPEPSRPYYRSPYDAPPVNGGRGGRARFPY